MDYPVLPKEMKQVLRTEKYRDILIKQRREHTAENVVHALVIYGNMKSKRFYIPGDKQYKRVLKSKHAIAFDSIEAAIADGFQRLEA